MFGELFEGLDGFEKGSVIYNHLQDACEVLWCLLSLEGTEGSKHPTRERRGKSKCSCISEDQSSRLEYA